MLRKTRVFIMRCLLTACGVMAFFVAPAHPLGPWASFAFLWGGYLLVMVGLGIRLWASLCIAARKSKAVVDEGPYSLCRHPLYVGTTLIALGAGLCFENLVVFLMVLLIVLPVHLAVAIQEEKHLRELFGEAYDEYCRTTPRFWPSFRSYREQTELNLPQRSIRRALIDATAVLAIAPGGQLVAILHQTGVLPAVWHF